MEKAVTNVTEKKSNKKQSALKMATRAASVVACAAMYMAQIGLCTGTTPTSVVNNLIGQIVMMMGLVGVVVCVIGVGKFALAMKDENPDGQTRAVYYAIAGAILIGLGPILSAVGVLTAS